MDESREQLDKIEEKTGATLKAIKSIEKRMETENELTPDQAARLGAEYIARKAEMSLLGGDHQTILLTEHGKGSSGLVAHLQENRSIFQNILQDALSGKYQKVKSYLKEKGENFTTPDDNYKPKPNERLLGEGFIALSNKIPDQGEPFTLPQPSWIDERYVDEGGEKAA